MKPLTLDFSEMDKIHNVDSATNGSPTRPVDPKTTDQPVCLTSGHVGKSLCLCCGAVRGCLCDFLYVFL